MGYTYLDKPKESVLTEPVKVGVIIPESGVAAYYGGQAKKGIEMAKEEILVEYPKAKFETFYEDSQYNPKIGVDAYNKLRVTNKLDGVITAATHVSVPIIPLTTEDKVVQMAIFASGAPYSKPDDLTFRISAASALETKVMADFIKDTGVKKVGIIYLNNEFGISFKDAFKNDLANNKSSTQIVAEEGFLVETSDFRTPLLKMKDNKADAVYIVGTAMHYANILKQSREIGLKVQFIGMRAAEDPVLIKNAAQLAEGLVYTYSFDENSGVPEAKKFAVRFREKYGVDPDGYAAEGYDGFKLLALAFINCGKDNTCVKSWLENLNDYKSVFGDIDFDNNGDIFYNFFLKTVKDGKFVKL